MESKSDFPVFPSLAAGEAAGMEQGLEFEPPTSAWTFSCAHNFLPRPVLQIVVVVAKSL